MISEKENKEYKNKLIKFLDYYRELQNKKQNKNIFQTFIDTYFTKSLKYPISKYEKTIKKKYNIIATIDLQKRRVMLHKIVPHGKTDIFAEQIFQKHKREQERSLSAYSHLIKGDIKDKKSIYSHLSLGD